MTSPLAEHDSLCPVSLRPEPDSFGWEDCDSPVCRCSEYRIVREHENTHHLEQSHTQDPDGTVHDPLCPCSTPAGRNEPAHVYGLMCTCYEYTRVRENQRERIHEAHCCRACDTHTNPHRKCILR